MVRYEFPFKEMIALTCHAGWRGSNLRVCFRAKVYLADGCEIWGHFVDGALGGVARGLDRDGRLSFACSFRDGAPVGPCWKKVHGGGCLYGRLDGRGRFTGDDIAFLYPDFSTAILGHFQKGILVRGKAARVTGISFIDGVLWPSFTELSDRSRLHFLISST